MHIHFVVYNWEIEDWMLLYFMLWFKFILGIMFFLTVSSLFATVPDYGNEYMTKEHKNWTGFKNFAPKINLNHNILGGESSFPGGTSCCVTKLCLQIIICSCDTDYVLFFCKSTGKWFNIIGWIGYL